MTRVAPVRKALVAAGGAFAAALAAAAQDGTLSGVDFLVAALAAVPVGVAVWRVENTPKETP